MENTTKKRFAFIPLKIENGENALPGEVLVDRTNGRFYVKDDNGNIISETENLDEKVRDIVSNIENEGGFGGNGIEYAGQRNTYRFFFDGTASLRLDRNLTLPSGAVYFNVRDVENEHIYYVATPTRVTHDAVYSGILQNNKLYWVTFFNIDGNAISQLLFTGKRADSVISDAVSPDKLLSRIEIELAKNEIYLGDRFAELFCRVYAYFADGSRQDVTTSNGLVLEQPDVTTTGTKTIKAVYYNIDDGRFATATADFLVLEEKYAAIVGIDVDPRVIVTNNGQKAIRLVIEARFETGEEKDISERCIVTDFNPSLFNEDQTITITTNYGRDQIYTTTYTINVELNVEKPHKLFFGESFIRLENTFDVVTWARYYRVREAGDLEKYYNMTYAEIGTPTDYVSSLRTGKLLVVEFYDETYEIIKSQVFEAHYRPDDFNLSEPVDGNQYLGQYANVKQPLIEDPSLMNMGIPTDAALKYPEKDPMKI